MDKVLGLVRSKARHLGLFSLGLFYGAGAQLLPATRRQISLLVDHLLLELLEGPESNCRLRDGAVDEDGQAAVEPLHAMLGNGLKMERTALEHLLLILRNSFFSSAIAASLTFQTLLNNERF